MLISDWSSDVCSSDLSLVPLPVPGRIVMKAKVAVLISGAGTNMAALLYAAKAETCPYELVLVASNDPDAAGLKIAHAEGIATWSLSHKGMKPGALTRLGQQPLPAPGATLLPPPS